MENFKIKETNNYGYTQIFTLSSVTNFDIENFQYVIKLLQSTQKLTKFSVRLLKTHCISS